MMFTVDQRRALGPTRQRKLPQQRTEYRTVAQTLMVVKVIISQRNPKDALPNQRPDLVLDQARITGVAKAAGQPIDQSGRRIGS